MDSFLTAPLLPSTVPRTCSQHRVTAYVQTHKRHFSALVARAGHAERPEQINETKLVSRPDSVLAAAEGVR